MLLGLSENTVTKLIARYRVSPVKRRGRLQFFRWCDLRQLLGREVVVRARGLSRAELMRIRLSKFWVAGYPHLVAEWHLDRNDDVYPYQVSYGSNRQIWWKCPKGPDHEWRSSPHLRIGSNQGCPFCSGRRASITNCLATMRPDLAQQWHPTKNTLTPRDVTVGSVVKVWWKCFAGPDHEWITSPNARTNIESGCPCCAGKQASITNSLATTAPGVAREWDRRKNGIAASKVVAGSQKHYWWKCRRGPDHEWRATVANRVKGKTGCPFCAGVAASVTNSIAAKRPALARQWHPTRNGALIPRNVVIGSQKHVWWKCPAAPDHEWRAVVDSRAIRGLGCPYCARKKVCRSNCLATQYPELAREWDRKKNGALTPFSVTPGSHKIVWWRCWIDRDHEWRAPPERRRRLLPYGCPHCFRQRIRTRHRIAVRLSL